VIKGRRRTGRNRGKREKEEEQNKEEEKDCGVIGPEKDNSHVCLERAFL
jgi:hypothetical protein